MTRWGELWPDEEGLEELEEEEEEWGECHTGSPCESCAKEMEAE